MITQLFVCYIIIFQKHKNKLVEINLSKQQALDADRKAIQKISFTKNLNHAAQIYKIFIPNELKEIVLKFYKIM